MTTYRFPSLVALVMLVGTITGSVESARAGANGSCGRDNICMWSDADFNACFYDLHIYSDGTGPPFSKEKYQNCSGKSLNDNLTSYRNASSSLVALYENSGQKGFAYCISPGASGNVIPSFNDKASSMVANSALWPAR